MYASTDIVFITRINALNQNVNVRNTPDIRKISSILYYLDIINIWQYNRLKFYILKIGVIDARILFFSNLV